MNEEIIWDFLMEKIQNPYGVAALMGNLYVESKLNPGLAESSKIRKLGMNSEEYIRRVDHGSYSADQFIHDGIGFGLVQWTYWSRKEALLNRAKAFGTSIGNLNMQLGYLWEEIQKYKTVIEAMHTATDIRTCSDVIVKRYEKPKNQGESYLANRAKYGQGYYDRFVVGKPEIPKRKYVIAETSVNVRTGNNTKYTKVLSLNKGQSLPYVGESENGWYAVEYKDRVLWLSKDFSRVEEL